MSNLGIIPRSLVPDTPRYLLNDTPLRDYGLFATSDGLKIEAVSPTTTYRSVPGMYGDYDMTFTNSLGGAYLPRRKVTLSVGSVGVEEDFQHTQIMLGNLVGKNVTIRDVFQPGEWRGRLSLDSWTVERNKFGCFLQGTNVLTLTSMPYMIGEAHSFTIPYSTTPAILQVNVLGNLPIFPTVQVTPQNGSSEQITIQSKPHDDVTYSRVLRLNPNGAWGDITLNVDMASGLVSENDGTPYYNIDMQTDFWALTPGLNDVQIPGASGTLTYEEEWTL